MAFSSMCKTTILQVTLGIYTPSPLPPASLTGFMRAVLHHNPTTLTPLKQNTSHYVMVTGLSGVQFGL